MLGIVGKTGAGKSTMANLIARLYDVTEGAITIDGINVRQLSLTQLRQSIGIVSQDIYLLLERLLTISDMQGRMPPWKKSSGRQRLLQLMILL